VGLIYSIIMAQNTAVLLDVVLSQSLNAPLYFVTRSQTSFEAGEKDLDKE
jgi:hypothetical protein